VTQRTANFVIGNGPLNNGRRPLRAGNAINFETWESFLAMLTPARLRVLKYLQEGPNESSISSLAKALDRQYRRVHEDVQVLTEWGLVQRDDEGKWITVDSIHVEMTVANSPALNIGEEFKYDPLVIKNLKRLASKNAEMLENLKNGAKKWGCHNDWPWNGFVLSGATRGGSARWQKNVKPRYDKELSWPVLSELKCEQKVQNRLKTVGRFKNKTGVWLWAMFEKIEKEGGPTQIRQCLNRGNAEQAIALLMSFPGCGPKYARNIMMDVYDERFREGYFAIDSRIKKLLPRLKYTGTAKYEDQERFLVGMAECVGMECWELDRLLYNKANEV